MSGDWQNGQLIQNPTAIFSTCTEHMLFVVQVQGDNGYKEGEAHCHVGLALENRGTCRRTVLCTCNFCINFICFLFNTVRAIANCSCTLYMCMNYQIHACAYLLYMYM